MSLPRKIFALALLALAAAGGTGYLWLRRTAPAPSMEAFRALPAEFALAWQVDVAALRKSLLWERVPLPKDNLGIDYRRDLDRISGVLTPERQTVVVAEGRLDSARLHGRMLRLDPARLLYSSDPKLLAAAQDRWRLGGPSADPQGIPEDAAFWMVGSPGSLGPVRVGPIAGTMIELPAELSSASRLVVAGKAGALSLELEAEAEYADAQAARRSADGFGGFLGLMKNLSVRRRGAEQVWKLFWESATVEADGNRVLMRGKLDEFALARLLPALVKPP